MPITKYHCTNYAGCNKAIEREEIEIEDGEDAICPEKDCGSKLEAVRKPGLPAVPKWIFAVIGAVLVVAGVGFWLLHQPPKARPAVADKTQNAQRTNPVVAQTPTPGPATAQNPQDCGDRQIAANLQDRFAHDEDIKREGIQVDVVNRTVVLSGSVSSDLARNYVIDMVGRNGCPVASIVNNIKIDSDKMIASRVQQAFAKDPTLRAQHIQVDASHGNVVLSGSVTENLMRTVAASTAGQIQGAATVTNNIRVQPNSPSRAAPDSSSGRAPHSTPTQVSLSTATLTGTWVGTYETCAQGHADISMIINESTPDDIVVSGAIAMPNASPGTFTSHGILNTMSSFLSLQFSGWQHQPTGLTVGDIGGYVKYVNQRPAEFSGIIRQPGCGKITLRKK